MESQNIEQDVDKIDPLDIDFEGVPDHIKDGPYSHLQVWATQNEPTDEMRFKEGYWGQIMFIRDKMYALLEKPEVDVISTHTSKSILLPVYRIIYKGEVEIILRDNFHGWVVTVKSEEEILIPHYENLFENKDDVNLVYCEGFKEDWVYPNYSYIPGKHNNNVNNFTVNIYNDYHLYTFLWLLSQNLKF